MMKSNKKLWWIGAVLLVAVVLFALTVVAATVEANATPTLTIAANTIELKNAVFMNFKVNCQDVDNPQNVKLLVWEEYPGTYDKATADATLSSIRTEEGTGYLVFQYDDLSAKEMTKFVYVCAYVDVNGTDVYSKPAKFSIVQYAYNTLQSNASAEKLKALVSGMLEYGALSQIYFEHNTEFLATDEVAKIKVVNGTHADGFKTGYYKAGTAVTLTANAPEEGYLFSHWTNAAGENVGTDSTLTIPACVTETYTAVYAEEQVGSVGLAYTYNESLGGYEVAMGECTDTEVVIPATYNGSPVLKIADNGFQSKAITEITIPDSVKSIGDWAFDSCTNLANITFPNSVTNIGICAFQYCTSLTSVSIGNSVTVLRTYVFGGCTSLTSVTISESVTDIGDFAFYHCNALMSVDIPGSVTSIGMYAFTGCTNLNNITIPDSVTSIGDYAFYECTKLTNVTIGNGVTNIGNYAFYYCTKLSSVTIGDSVMNIGDYAFQYCTKLTSVEIPDSTTNIGSHTFQYCISMTSVTMGNNLTSIGEYAFYECTSLADVTIPDSVTGISNYTFSGCTNLMRVTIGGNVTNIGNDAFSGCDSLRSVTIPDSVTSIGAWAFAGCSNLKDIYISDFSAWLNISFSSYYSNPCCNGANLHLDNEILTAITIPDSITEIKNYAFYGCTSLTSAKCPSVPSIGEYTFYNCTTLADVEISDHITSIGYSAFDGCLNLSKVYYKGDEGAWSSIDIDSRNYPLTNATHYFYSESQPAVAGNYWRYVDGVPTPW